MRLSISQRGFTIVELLIVIVVIAVLAALVINTFTGIQKRARDTERESDLKTLALQLEAYYNDAGSSIYPNTNTFNTAWVQANLKIDPNALRPPGTTNDVIEATAASANDTTPPASTPAITKDYYVYEPRTSGGAICTNQSCSNFKLWYVKEENNENKVRKSINQ